MFSDLERVSALLEKALCWLDSGSQEAGVILAARNIVDVLLEDNRPNPEPGILLPAEIEDSLSRETADVVLSTAIESGIPYWLNEEESISEVRLFYSEDFLNYKALRHKEDFDFTKPFYSGISFHEETIGVVCVTAHLLMLVYPKFVKEFPQFCIKDGIIKVEAADALFQYAVFGKVVYG